MISVEEMAAFVEARAGEDELWALAASAPYHGDGPTVEGGVHWTWAIGENWTPIDVEPTVEHLGEDRPEYECDVRLITREAFPLSWPASLEGRCPNELNGRVISSDGYEVRTGDGGHIVRHDPARVLREVAAKRKRIARWRDVDRLWAEWPEGRVGADLRSVRRAFGCAVADDAAVYSWHPDYQVAWDEWANPPD